MARQRTGRVGLALRNLPWRSLFMIQFGAAVVALLSIGHPTSGGEPTAMAYKHLVRTGIPNPPPEVWWDTSNITYQVVTIDYLHSVAPAAAALAFEQWDKIMTDADLELERIHTTQADINVWPGSSPLAGPGWYDNFYDNQFNYIIVGSTITLNDEWTWNTSGNMDPDNEIVDVRSVVIHEVGHSLGWEHKYDWIGSGCDPNNTTGEGYVQYDSAMCTDWEAHNYTNAQDRLGQRIKYGTP